MLLYFAEATKRVEEMERERQKLDRQLDLAQEKSKKANIGQEVLEAKMKVCWILKKFHFNLEINST